jgi:hypothetical protein
MQPSVAASHIRRKESKRIMEDTQEEVHSAGHRQFVGGNGDFWGLIGALQFDFLVARGLSPQHTLLDIGCGALRGGIHFIRYLDRGRYLGIDKYIELIIYGVAQELGLDAFAAKQPRFVVSDRFEFDRFGVRPHFAIAQSLFTHLAATDIKLCLVRLREEAAPRCRFFATFFEVDTPHANAVSSHSHGFFGYTRAQMEAFGEEAGWRPNYIGAWNHPRNQKIIEYVRD